MLVWLGRRTVQNMVGSVHAVIWQAGTNWAGPVRIQIYYGPECIRYFSAQSLLIFTQYSVLKLDMDHSFHISLLKTN